MRNTVYTTSTLSVHRRQSVSKGMAKMWKAPVRHTRELRVDEEGFEYETCADTCLCKRLPVLG
jgi:hypothetical protein